MRVNLKRLLFVLILFTSPKAECKPPPPPPEPSNRFEMGKMALQNPTSEIKYAYYYFVPDSLKKNGTAKIFLCTDGGPDYDQYDELVKSLFLSRIPALSRLAEQHGYVLIMPILPRNYGPDPAYKMGAQMFNRYTLMPAPFDTSKFEFDKRPDLTILKIIDHVSEELVKNKIKPQKKIFMAGFSSGGVVANRFSILYPERVEAVALGSPGVFMYPLSSWKGVELTYPVGIADVDKIPRPKITLDEFKKIPHFVLVGEKDTEHGHTPVPENPETDREELFEKSQSRIILKYFGKTNVERAQKFNDYLISIGMKPKFTLYKGLGHQYTDDMKKDIFEFFDSVSKSSR